MRKSDAVAFYGTQQKLADAIARAQSTVASWGDVVPLEHAYVLERLTRRRLRIDLALYPKLPPVLRKAS